MWRYWEQPKKPGFRGPHWSTERKMMSNRQKREWWSNTHMVVVLPVKNKWGYGQRQNLMRECWEFSKIEIKYQVTDLRSYKIQTWSWPVWLSWLSLVPQSELWRFDSWPGHMPALQVRSGWGTFKRQPTDISLSHQCFSPSPTLSLSLKINK